MSPDGAALFSGFDFSGHDVLTVAVSGGSDSLALLILARQFVQRHASGLGLIAVTVDHALRPESATEARQVAAICAGLGVEHRIMIWSGDKPATGIAAAAREARYGLLARAAIEAGSTIVLTGHTMDDQAETVAMRARRAPGDEGAHGMAGMAPFTLFDESVWIVRPLLGARRMALRALLRDEGLGWIEDPTNCNPAQERVRVREALGTAADEDDPVTRLAAEANDAGRERALLAVGAAQFLHDHVSQPSPGLWRIDRSTLRASPEAAPVLYHAMRILLATVGGCPYLPDTRRTEALLHSLTAERARATLSRTLVQRTKDAIWLRRERRNLPAPSFFGGPRLWDGRLRVEAGDEAGHIHVGPCPEGGWDAGPDLPEVVPPAMAKAAFSTEPGLWNGQEFLGHVVSQAARARGVKARPAAAPFTRYLSGFDLPVATLVNSMIGAEPLPEPPSRNHNVQYYHG